MVLHAQSDGLCSTCGDDGHCSSHLDHMRERVETLEQLTGLALGLAVIGGMTLVMTMFVMVNMAHRTRRLIWHIIKETVSIFAAVLLFNMLSTFVEKSLEEQYNIWEFVNNSFYLCFYGTLLFWVRQWAVHPLHDKRDQHVKIERSIRLMEVGLVAAHACGFALTEGWGQRLQVGGLVYGLWPMQFTDAWQSMLLLIQVVVQYLVILAVLMWLRRRTTESRIREEHEAGEESKLLKKYVEVMTDGENDIMGILVAFLVTMIVRQAITGRLPEKNGKDRREVLHEVSIADAVLLAIIGVVALIISIVYEVRFMLPPQKQKEKVAHLSPFWKPTMLYMFRMADIFRNITTMTCAWCWMFAHTWLFSAIRFGNGEPHIISLCLAISVSAEVCAFVLAMGIYGGRMAEVRHEAEDALQRQVSQESTDEQVDTVIQQLRTQFLEWAAHDSIFRNLRALMEKISGFLLGFTWESCFDIAVEGLTEYFEKGGNRIISSYTVQLFIGCMVVFLILPVWGAFIVPMVTESGYRFGFVPRKKRDQCKKEGWEDDIVGAFQVLHEYNNKYREYEKKRDEGEEAEEDGEEDDEFGVVKHATTRDGIVMSRFSSLSPYLQIKARAPAKYQAASQGFAAGIGSHTAPPRSLKQQQQQQRQQPQRPRLQQPLAPQLQPLQEQQEPPLVGSASPATATAFREARGIAAECAKEAGTLRRLADSLATPRSRSLEVPLLS